MTSEPISKTCEFCGQTFGCGAKLDRCWCSEVTVPAAIAEFVRSKYADCLCSNCLRKISAGAAIVIKYSDGTCELLPEAVRVDTQNFHEGMIDFYDDRGNLLKQISMNIDLQWEIVNPGREE